MHVCPAELMALLTALPAMGYAVVKVRAWVRKLTNS